MQQKLIPKIILLASQNKKIPIYGTGKNIRDWLFVDDHCDVIFDVLLSGKSGQSYNISAENEIDNVSVVKKILNIMDKSEDLINYVDDRPGHDLRYSLDSSKIRNELNWNQKISFDDGIKKTVDWYLNNSNLYTDMQNEISKSTPWK